MKIIPSELIVSGSARRLRSVDAKLKEEMKSLNTPSKQNSSASSAPQTQQPQPQIMSPEKKNGQMSAESSSPRRLRTPAKPLQPPKPAPNSALPKRIRNRTPTTPKNPNDPMNPQARTTNGRFLTTSQPQRTATPVTKGSSTRRLPPPLPPPSLDPPSLTTGMWGWGKKAVKGLETWFPAEIADPAGPNVPASFSKQAQEMRKEGMVLLRYIEGGGARSWGWHSHRGLLRFGTARVMKRRIRKLDDYGKNLVTKAFEEALKHVVTEDGEDGDEEDGGGDD